MTGDLSIGKNKIITTSDPTNKNHLTRKEYIDVNFLLISNFRKQMCFSIFNDYLENKANTFYKIEYPSHNDLLFDRTGGEIKKIYDKGIDGKNLEQTTTNLQPLLCDQNEKINNKYFLKFNGSQRMISDVNLNTISGKKDITNIFIVYKIISYPSGSSWYKNGLLGNDNGGFDKFIAFGSNKQLVIGSDTGQFCSIGSGSLLAKYPIAPFKTTANAGEIEIWYNQSKISDENFTATKKLNQPILRNSSVPSKKKFIR